MASVRHPRLKRSLCSTCRHVFLPCAPEMLRQHLRSGVVIFEIDGDGTAPDLERAKQRSHGALHVGMAFRIRQVQSSDQCSRTASPTCTGSRPLSL